MLSISLHKAAGTNLRASAEENLYHAQRSIGLNMLRSSTVDKACVNTEIELFGKVDNCLICDLFTNLIY